MPKLFLDPDKPIHTCQRQSCTDCSVARELNCHFNLKQLMKFLLFSIPPFIIGGIGINLYNSLYLIPWILFIISYFGLIEIRVMCSHCPHYAEPSTKSLKCWANYGSPKFWQYRPGPMSKMEKIIFIGGLVIIFFYPLIFLLLEENWLLIIMYLLLSFSFALLLHKVLCPHCMNFACPLNRVKKDVREEFFKNNPLVGKAWKFNQK